MIKYENERNIMAQNYVKKFCINIIFILYYANHQVQHALFVSCINDFDNSYKSNMEFIV